MCVSLGPERKRRKRRIETKEEDKTESVRRALEIKMAAIGRKLQEKQRGRIRNQSRMRMQSCIRYPKGEEPSHKPVTWYELTKRKLLERMTIIERKLEEKKRGKQPERKRQWTHMRENERRKAKRQRVRKKNSQPRPSVDQDYGTPATSKLDGAAKFQPALEIIDYLMSFDLAIPFSEPVDPVKYHIPDYFVKIRKPMDLGTVRTNVTKRKYKELWQIWADIRLIWENCRSYNGPSNPYTIKANALSQMFEERLQVLTGITVRKSGRKRKRPRRLDDMLPLPRFARPLDKRALEEEINSLSLDELDKVVTMLVERGRAIKDEKGDYEIDYDAMGEETVCEMESLLSIEDQDWNAGLEDEEVMKVKKPVVQDSGVQKLTLKPDRRQTIALTGSNWSSKLGAIKGTMEHFEVDSDDVYSSSSSSDWDEVPFTPPKMATKPINIEASRPAEAAVSSICKKPIICIGGIKKVNLEKEPETSSLSLPEAHDVGHLKVSTLRMITERQ